jgi:predicted nucleic acid-binding protein
MGNTSPVDRPFFYYIIFFLPLSISLIKNSIILLNIPFIMRTSSRVKQSKSTSVDVEKLNKILSLYAAANEKLFYTADSRKRSLFFLQQGLKLPDSLHLALAEEYQQNVLLTTDDRFIKAAAKAEVGLPVENPVVWLMKYVVVKTLFDSISRSTSWGL